MIYRALWPIIRLLDAESAHHLTLRMLNIGAGALWRAGRTPASLRSTVLNLDFPNPIGIAAGFDKDGVAATPLLKLGFGFIELGTVTPRPQAGNPQPRLFRLTEDRAVINRMGFNNHGAQALVARLARYRVCQAETTGEFADPGLRFGIGTDHYRIGVESRGAQIICDRRHCRQIIRLDVGEDLCNILCTMQVGVDRDDPVNGSGDQAADDFLADRLALMKRRVLPHVAEIGRHQHQSPGAFAPQRLGGGDDRSLRPARSAQ